MVSPFANSLRPGDSNFAAPKLIENKTMMPPMLELLSATVQGRLNILISGGTGAGKTTLLNVLSGYIPETERVITIEDAAELQLKRNHVLRLETRPPNIEGKGAIRQRELVINSLRMRPDRIVVGEVRGEEAFDMLQAMNTGHEGSLTTVHANSQRDALSRIENMVSMANLSIPERAIRRQLASAIHAVVQVSRLSDGTRKVMSISEVMGIESDVISMQDIFVFNQQSIDESGRVHGLFRSTGEQTGGERGGRDFPPNWCRKGNHYSHFHPGGGLRNRPRMAFSLHTWSSGLKQTRRKLATGVGQPLGQTLGLRIWCEQN